MDDKDVIHHIITTFTAAQMVAADGNSFFFAGDDRKLPFATVVTNDTYDQFSDLDRAEIYRLNVGVTKETFERLVGKDAMEAEHDFTALDRILPHPVYGRMHWVCVLNPSETTFAAIRAALAEAFDLAARRKTRSHDDAPV